MKITSLDKLFSQYIRMRAIERVGGCERCLTPKVDIVKDNGDIFPAWKQIQCSHFIGRARRATKYDPDNAVGLCGACHMYFTAHPTEYVQWFMDYLGEEKVDLLMARNRQRERPDENAITLYLKAEITKLAESL